MLCVTQQKKSCLTHILPTLPPGSPCPYFSRLLLATISTCQRVKSCSRVNSHIFLCSVVKFCVVWSSPKRYKQTNKQTNRNNKRVYHWTLLLDTSDCYNSSSSSSNNNNNSHQKRRCGNFILKPLNLFSNNDHTDKSTSENNVYWSKLSEKYFLSSSELCNSINKHMVNSMQGVGASPWMALWDACQIVKSGNLWHKDSYFFIR